MALKGVKSQLQNRRQVVVANQQSNLYQVGEDGKLIAPPPFHQTFKDKNTRKEVMKYCNEISEIHQEIQNSKDMTPTQELSREQFSKQNPSSNTNTKGLISPQNYDASSLISPPMVSEPHSNFASNKVIKSKINQKTVGNSKELNVEEESAHITQTFSPL